MLLDIRAGATLLPITGAIVAQIPDGAITGGNARGINAVDLQTFRGAAVEVASGSYSGILSGLSNRAPGYGGVVAGGQGNNADATVGWIPGGLNASTRLHYGAGAWASGIFAALGDAQARELMLRRIGTDGTTIRATADTAAPSAGNTINLPNNSTFTLLAMVTARQTGGSAGTVGDSAHWWLAIGIKRGANAAATVVTSVQVLHSFRDAGAAAWAVAAVADTTLGALAAQCAGELNKTIQWVWRVMAVETTG